MGKKKIYKYHKILFYSAVYIYKTRNKEPPSMLCTVLWILLLFVCDYYLLVRSVYVMLK